MTLFRSYLCLLTACLSLQVLAKPLPTDPSVHEFTLKNGLTCWVKPHKTPPGKVSVWLHIGSGSLNEEENQQGLAHYLEHMAFNGSENFKPGEMIKFFEAMGLQFGRHQNAFTSFDQTTYQLAMPDVKDETIEKALICMADFAYRLSLTPDEVKREMGVIVEEARARDGLGKRLSDKRIAQLFPNSRLKKRMPIGKLDVIQSATPELLTSYYTKWYRPDLSTLIIVGDVNVETVKKQIEAQFNDWTQPADEVQAYTNGITPYTKPRAGIITDPELKTASISIFSLREGMRKPTAESYRGELVQDLGNWMLTRRLNTMVREGKAPFQSGGAGSGYWYKGVFMCSASVSGHPKNSRKMLRSLALEIQRARKHGFLEQELKQAVTSTISGLEQAVKTEPTQNSRSIASSLNRQVEEGYLPMSAQQRLDLVKPMITGITLKEIHAAFVDNYPTDKRMVLAVVPEKPEAYGESKPFTDESELLNIIKVAENEETTQKKGEAEISTLMEGKPVPGTWAESTVDKDLTIFSGTLNNGVRAHIREMDYKKNQVIVRITLAGGRIMEGAKSKGLTQAGSLVFGQKATKEFTSTQIRNFMTGKNVGVGAGAGADSVMITISGAPKDLEYGFQLAHLLLTQPKLEASALENWRKQFHISYQEGRTSASARLREELPKLLFPNEPRVAPLTPEDVDAITIAAAEAWLQGVIADSMIELSVVGDIKPERAKELVATYIGSLPKRPDTTKKLDALRTLHVPTKKVNKVLDIESIANRSEVIVGWRTVGWDNKREVLAIKLATMILENRVRDEIREKRGWTYSSSVFDSPSAAYTNSSFMGVYFTADPDKAVEAMDVAAEIISAFTKDGPTAEEMDTAKKQLANSLDQSLKEPSFWAGKLADLDYHGFTLDYIKSIKQTYQGFTAEDIRSTVETYVKPDRQFELIVRKKK